MPLRLKLTLSFALIVLVILATTASLLYVFLGRYLLNEADRNLEVYTSQVHGSLLPANIDAPVDFNVVHAQLPSVNGFASPDIYVQIMDDTGNIVVRSDNLYRDALPSTRDLSSRAMHGHAAFGIFESVDLARVRVMATPLYLQNRTLVLEVAQSLSLMDSTLARLRVVLIAGVSLAVVLVAVAGALTLRRAFVPVSKISRIARQIEESADLSRRVGRTGPDDEIGQLASTFDHMIARLETLFRSQTKFTADASHELRSPLAVIRANLDLIRKHPDKDNVAESLRAIESEANRMSKIVNDLLLLAEIETGKRSAPDVVNLSRVAKEEVERARGLASDRHIAFSGGDDVRVRGDSHQLHQLIWNLLENAVKHTPAWSDVMVSVTSDDACARLDVSDTGPGIPAEHLSHLFDRFYRVDKARSRSMGSHGLGLAIVKGIAEAQGGSVSVSSEPGKGTTFSVQLKT